AAITSSRSQRRQVACAVYRYPAESRIQGKLRYGMIDAQVHGGCNELSEPGRQITDWSTAARPDTLGGSHNSQIRPVRGRQCDIEPSACSPGGSRQPPS
ncbi:hypothetical protein CABS03_00205, partial [Colletotrichum abscissum]